MVEVASRHPFMSLQDVAAATGVGNIHVSHGGMLLKKAGLQTFNPCGKVGLSQENKASRLLLRE